MCVLRVLRRAIGVGSTGDGTGAPRMFWFAACARIMWWGTLALGIATMLDTIVLSFRREIERVGPTLMTQEDTRRCWIPPSFWCKNMHVLDIIRVFCSFWLAVAASPAAATILGVACVPHRLQTFVWQRRPHQHHQQHRHHSVMTVMRQTCW